ncbi:YfbU family protein [Kosakonia sp. S58]|uniref:YfbU family protein n=1 Tax=unclassified Kosakonia TaxID=2632876 RepID=UPI00190887BF|nr:MULTISPECIES: YfbU family protein [unclassified Kosakonia]MBK0079764.1 YfbU family protein [Kosakonia sp. S57]MBK0086726.1 YfbU family protein [Kosakonia sp. S58]
MSVQDKINTILLCEIAIKLGIDTPFDPRIVNYAVSSGNEWVLEYKYPSLASRSPTQIERDFVAGVFSMYRGLSVAFSKLSVAEQTELIAAHRLRVEDGTIQLPGFDRNNESNYFSIANAFLEIQQFPEQKKPLNNTHSHTKKFYERMLQKFQEMNVVKKGFNLTVYELNTLLMRAPSYS